MSETVAWKVVHTVKVNMVCVRVTQSAKDGFYSLEIGRVNKRDEFTRFFPVQCGAMLGKAIVTNDSSGDVQKAIEEAYMFIVGENQRKVDDAMDRKIERERRDSNKGKFQEKPGLKKLGEMYGRKPGDIPPSAPPSEDK